MPAPIQDTNILDQHAAHFGKQFSDKSPKPIGRTEVPANLVEDEMMAEIENMLDY